MPRNEEKNPQNSNENTSVQWWIQTGAMGCKKPMKTANLNLIQYINFVLGKNNEQGDDSIFRRGDNFVKIGSS